MKKLKLTKMIVSSLIIASVLILNPIGANAEWKQDGTGWWYSEGQKYDTGWNEIDGEWYYFDNNGYMKTGWIQQAKNNWYYLNDSGVMAKNTTINGYVLDSVGVWIPATQNNLSNSEQDKKVAEDYIKSKGYEIATRSGEIDNYTLDKSMLISDPLYGNIWGVQEVEPDKYLGKQITTYGFIVKNHPLEKIYKVDTNVCIMISDGQVIGGYSSPNKDYDGGLESLDGKSLEEVKGISYKQWLNEWKTKYAD